MNVRESVAKSVVGRIEELIATEAMPSGARLPSERTLAATLGVARTSVREALSQLIRAGVLRSEPGRGTFVRGATPQGEPKSSPVPDGLSPVVDGKNYTKLEVSHFRKMIEGQSARLAAMRITDDQIVALERNLAQFKSETRAMEMENSAGPISNSTS
jgi:DNA-binding FadR family transcriptional regulator